MRLAERVAERPPAGVASTRGTTSATRVSPSGAISTLCTPNASGTSFVSTRPLHAVGKIARQRRGGAARVTFGDDRVAARAARCCLSRSDADVS